MKNTFYKWWKQKPSRFRKPLVFVLGLLLLIVSPIIGSVPGPGGIALFLLSIAILASEFDWAEELKAFFLHTVPKEIKNRWHPTPRWAICFDITSFALLIGALGAVTQGWWALMLSLGMGGITLFIFNRDRLTRLKKLLTKK